ncbi:MAG: winged helix-turn-helix transcriptional regulator [Rubrivivax sp.]|jgi:DNA-binding MarR family transcriptional regulator|nr:winged helix-turn-helix transcriptional regulator [Rubrivivax sp.]MBK7262163.1 winged helix-turn-helix transcriptional regulator [Rubrivivax sp.]MBK8528381.1 winged helix-turn-helix transcriptional regulator [Rubrivivax sp.]
MRSAKPHPVSKSSRDAAPARPFPPYDARRYVVSQSVGHQIVNLMTLMRRELETRMAAVGLTDAQWKPLWMLDSGRADTGNEMARCLEMDAGAVTRLLDRLEAKGLLERTRSEADRRVVRLQLTPAGKAAAVQVPHVLASVNNDFLQGFSEAEWLQLRALIERMSANGAALLAARSAA